MPVPIELLIFFQAMWQEFPQLPLCFHPSFSLRCVTMLLFSQPPGLSVEYFEHDPAWLSHPPLHMPHTKVCTFVNETRRRARFKTMLPGDSTTWRIGLTTCSLFGQQAHVRPSMLCDSSQALSAPCEPPCDSASLRIPSSVRCTASYRTVQSQQCAGWENASPHMCTFS